MKIDPWNTKKKNHYWAIQDAEGYIFKNTFSVFWQRSMDFHLMNNFTGTKSEAVKAGYRAVKVTIVERG